MAPTTTDEFSADTTFPERAPAFVSDADRRRPGRVDVNSELVPLLRGPFDTLDRLSEDTCDHDHRDVLAPARGIIIGLSLAMPFWIGLVTIVWIALT